MQQRSALTVTRDGDIGEVGILLWTDTCQLARGQPNHDSRYPFSPLDSSETTSITSTRACSAALPARRDGKCRVAAKKSS